MARASSLRIGRVLGIPINLHPSWFVIFSLITFSLATQFTQQHPHWSIGQRWSLGVLTSLLFFGSVLLHELAHSVVAIRYRIPVLSITLFVFGGIAHMGRDPDSAKQEFNIAIAGPLSSYLLAGFFRFVLRLFPQNEMLSALAFWLAWVNFGVATFNLVPGFPLDGGRIFRALAWSMTKSYKRATQLAARSGQLIAYAMIIFGSWRALTGNLFGGLWIAFIGWFLLTAAQESVVQAMLRTALTGLRVADVMNYEIPTVGREMSLNDYSQLVLRTGRRCHFVTADGRLLGLMNVHALNSVPREEWHGTSVQAAMIPDDKILWTSADQQLLPLLERMVANDVNQVPVLNKNGSRSELLGIVTRDSILRVMQAHLELRTSVASRER
jgi:Zn-dependent protease/predicted transcriptional regulator